MKTTIDPEKIYWASFERFEMRVPGEAVLGCSHSGQCDEDVSNWSPKVRELMESDNFQHKPTPDKVRAELAEFGTWDEEELADDNANWNRIVWIACGNISENEKPDFSEPLKA